MEVDEYCLPQPRVESREWFGSIHRPDWDAKRQATFHKLLTEMWEMAVALGDVCELSEESHSDLEDRFIELAERWAKETRHISSTTKMVLHPSYQSIIGMGQDVVPLLLRDLKKHRRFWFWALAHITNENPVPPACAGNIDKMIEAWLDWGKHRGIALD